MVRTIFDKYDDIYDEGEYVIGIMVEHIDSCIRYWRRRRNRALLLENGQPDYEMAVHYIDAYQSMRTSLFGELLPEA